MIYVIDLFAGAGGTSTGVNRAIVNGQHVAKVITCVNHNPVAIASHMLNHDCEHVIEDVTKVNLMGLRETVRRIRVNDPEALIVLWGSPDCTGHSLANGNKKKNPDLRSLANSMIRYIKILRPDYVMVENVLEFKKWGPCDKNGRPIESLKGTLYLKWYTRIMRENYRYSHRSLCAADYGGYTTRTRYFGMFAKGDLPLVFPKPTHSKKAHSSNLFDQLQPWKPVKEVLDLENVGKSVLTNDRLRADKTFRRLYLGCKKYVPQAQDRFFVKYQGTSITADIDLPAPTLTKKDRLGYVKLEFINNHFGNSTFSDLENPIGALTKNPKQEFVTIEKQFLFNPQFNSKGGSIEDPCFTLIARMDKKPPELISAVRSHYWEPRKKELQIMLEHSEGYKAKLIQFMIDNQIYDIKKRMLSIPELLRIQGFGDDYKLTGTITEQKEFIGNSVHPIIPKCWFEALHKVLENQREITMNAA